MLLVTMLIVNTEKIHKELIQQSCSPVVEEEAQWGGDEGNDDTYREEMGPGLEAP